MKDKKQSRREFLKSSVVGVASLVALKDTMAGGLVLPEVHTELNEVTVSELQAGMKSGKFTSKALVEKYLERIKEIDPKLRSVIETNPDAIKIAEQMDKERRRGKVRSMMHGIPVLIKDNIDTRDRMKTTAGSYALVDAPTPKRDAFIVRQLRKSGAVIIGKTNLSEWANFRSTKSISGWSGRGGQTNNPYILDKIRAARLRVRAWQYPPTSLPLRSARKQRVNHLSGDAKRRCRHQADTRISVQKRNYSDCHTQDTAGPMTRTVADAAILLSVLVGEDKRDQTTAESKKGEKDYTKFLDCERFARRKNRRGATVCRK
jgi:amidase